MRTAFIEEFVEQARVKPNTFLAVGDLGFGVVESFADEFPDRFLNAGVAEQNMTTVAAGLAQVGYNVFTYSIANFPTLRCLEQIRNDVCYHDASVKVVSVGAGLAYGQAGYSHHALQDIACMRTLPGLLMATPCDPVEARAVTAFLCNYDGPAYLRLGKAGETQIHQEPVMIQKPGLVHIREGGDSVVIACGSVATLAQQAADTIGASLYSAALWSGNEDTVNDIIQIVDRHERVVVVEEHLPTGGFGSFVRECLEIRPELQCRVRCVALDSSVCGQVGSQDFLREAGGLTPAAIKRAAA